MSFMRTGQLTVGSPTFSTITDEASNPPAFSYSTPGRQRMGMMKHS